VVNETVGTGAVPATSRRRLLGWAGLGLAGGVAGCGDDDDDPGPGLYASNAQVLHRPGDDRFDYPEDVAVRVTVENTTSDRQTKTLRTVLERLDDAETTPTVADSWVDRRQLSISRGTSRAKVVVFERVLGETDEEVTLRARAEFA
jgi:hypothetical protein